MLTKLLQAINLASYENQPEDTLTVKLEYLLVLRKEIINLKDEINRYKKELKLKNYEIKKLTGKLIEKDLQSKSLDIYI